MATRGYSVAHHAPLLYYLGCLFKFTERHIPTTPWMTGFLISCICVRRTRCMLWNTSFKIALWVKKEYKIKHKMCWVFFDMKKTCYVGIPTLCIYFFKTGFNIISLLWQRILNLPFTCVSGVWLKLPINLFSQAVPNHKGNDNTAITE